MSRHLTYYITAAGRWPFLEWMENYDETIRLLILSYLDRAADGGAQNNIKSLKGGIYEIKINRGPGYRIYFAYVSNETMLLLLGGDKQTQSRDIRLAREYWRQYESDR